MTSKKLAFAVSVKMVFSLTALKAVDYTWVAPASNNDLNTASNWSPNGVPGINDNGIFDSTNGANLFPTSTITTFQVNNLEFPNSAYFQFNFNNSEFDLGGSITGTNTNPQITATNNQNSISLDYQIQTSLNTPTTLSSGLTTVTNMASLSGASSQTQLTFSRIYDGQLGSNNGLTIPAGAIVNISNTGTYTNQNSMSNGNNIAQIEVGQLNVNGSNFVIEDNVLINISNRGIDNSNTQGANNVGTSGDGFFTTATTTVGDNVTLNVANEGTFSGSTSNGENVGIYTFTGIFTGQPLNTGDNFTLNFSNIGNDSSTTTGNGENQVGCITTAAINLNTTSFGNNTTINVSNQGTKSGSSAPESFVGVCDNIITSSDPLTALDNFTLNVENIGVDTSTTPIGAVNYVGTFGPGQQFNNGVSVNLGNNATINISNSGTSSNPNSIVAFGGTQFNIAQFSAGKNLNLTVTNEGINNSGNPTAKVGYLNAGQIFFSGPVTLQDGSTITAENNGTGYVTDSQIHFFEGFNLTGSATMKATNASTATLPTGIGIEIDAGTGGDVNIILENNSLYIPNGSQFTIGALNGNVNSSVLSTPALTIDLDPGVIAVFDGTIEATTPSLLITGFGTQVFNGANNYTGLTTVNGGTLVENGTLAGGLTVEGTGTLSGTGSISGPVVANARGVIAPGPGIGTINFLNDFMNNGANYDVEVNGAGQSDLINVSGTAVINGGEVVVSSSNGTYDFNHRYTILTASTALVDGYSGAISLNPLLTPHLTKDFKHIYLTLSPNFIAGARTHNQIEVATQIDGILKVSVSQQALLNAIAGLPLGSVGAALDSLSGYQHTSDLFTTTAINRQFIRRLYDPLRSLTTCPCSCNDPCSTPITFWVEGGGVFTHQNSDINAHGFTTNGYEITAGLQTSLRSNLTVGVAGSYEHDDLKYSQESGKAHSDTYFAGLYGLYNPTRFYGLVDLAYGYTTSCLDRDIVAGRVNYTAHSKPNVSQFTAYGEVGINLTISRLLIQPFVAIEGEAYWRQSVKESGAGGFELDVRKRNLSTATSRLGAHLTGCLSIFSLSLDVAWNARFSQCKNRIDEEFAEFGTPFEIYGIDLQRNSVDYALTASTTLNDRWDVYLEGSGESWKNSQVFNVLAGLKFSW